MTKKTNWKTKLNFWLLNFHQEVKKTSTIGKKMLTASRTNAYLTETYIELGKLLERGVESGEVDWDSPKLRSLLHTVKACKKDLEDIEKQVNKIKFSSGPQDISKVKSLSDETKKD
jgi:hypothetical protein